MRASAEARQRLDAIWSLEQLLRAADRRLATSSRAPSSVASFVACHSWG